MGVWGKLRGNKISCYFHNSRYSTLIICWKCFQDNMQISLEPLHLWSRSSLLLLQSIRCVLFESVWRKCSYGVKLLKAFLHMSNIFTFDHLDLHFTVRNCTSMMNEVLFLLVWQKSMMCPNKGFITITSCYRDQNI